MEQRARATDRSPLQRITKAIVIASTLCAVLFQLWYAGRALPALPWLALAGGVIAYLCGRRHPERTTAVVLATGYLTPVLWLLVTPGVFYWNFSLWAVVFIGAAAATSTGSWEYPARFRFPLVTWALGIALTWPIVAMRELDWMPSLLWTNSPTGRDAMHAIPTTVWISQVAEIHLLGLLWIDWLFGRFGGDASERFERVIIQPLLVGAALAGLLALYQGFVNLHFLSVSFWPTIGRASGSLADGNASGALSALWVTIPLGMAAAAHGRVKGGFWTVIALILLGAAWVTGSRTALLVVAIGLASGVHLVVRGHIGRRRLMVAAGALVVTVGIMVLGLRSSTIGPVRRVQDTLPNLSKAAIRSAVRELWVRKGYGPAADAMIKDAPLGGVGVGMFHALSPSYLRLLGEDPGIPADNAQNWFRHQLAELGILGSVGWISWSVLLTAVLFGGRTAPEWHVRGLTLKYTIAGFGVASLLGMPSQNLFVAMTVWTLAFWLLLITGMTDTHRARGRRPLIAALAVASVFAAVTAYAARGNLRPPFRAKQLGFAYQYGLYQPIEAQSGTTQTSGRSVAVPAARGTLLKLTVWVEHPDADQRPVPVEVWVDHQRIIRGRFPRNVPLMRLVPMPGGTERFVLETKVARTFTSPQGQVGLTIAWEFQDPK